MPGGSPPSVSSTSASVLAGVSLSGLSDRRVSGVDSASDRKFTEITGQSVGSGALDLTP